MIRTESFRQTLASRNNKLKQLGIVLPKIGESNVNKRGIPVIPQSYIAETTMRAYYRQQKQQQIQAIVNNRNDNIKCNNEVPSWLLQPNSGNWYRPLPLLLHSNNNISVVPSASGDGRDDHPNLSVIEFDEAEMRNFMNQHFPYHNDRTTQSTTTTAAAANSNDSFVTLWGLCAVYWYGGYFVSYKIRTSNELNEIIKHYGSSNFDDNNNIVDQGTTNSGCHNNNNNNNNNVAIIEFQNNKLHYIKATPRHPLVACAIRKLQQQQQQQQHDPYVNPSLFLSREDLDGMTSLQGGAWFSSDGKNCNGNNDSLDSVCCSLVRTDHPRRSGHGTDLFLRTFYDKDVENVHEDVLTTSISQPRVQISVKLVDSGTPSSNNNEEKVPKRPIAQHMLETNCQAGWFCNRCYHTEWYGTYNACTNVCNACHQNIICDEPYNPERKDVFIEVIANERRPLNPDHSATTRVADKRIPRIVHQTYFEELTPDRYPDLIRLQNSWKALPGWEYRFYTDKSARMYIQSNYPSRFVEAFDALIPGAFKVNTKQAFYSVCLLLLLLFSFAI